MEQAAAKIMIRAVAVMYMALILNGSITSPEQIPGKVDKWDYQCLAGTIMCENPYGTELNCLLTGSVVINRKNSSNWHGDTIEEVILAKDGGFIQYAQDTRNRFRTIECSDRVKAIAKYLLIFGPVCPSNVVYQGKNKNAGSGVFWKEPTPNEKIKYEYYCYE